MPVCLTNPLDLHGIYVTNSCCIFHRNLPQNHNVMNTIHVTNTILIIIAHDIVLRHRRQLMVYYRTNTYTRPATTSIDS